jgi:hypothetical protein
LPAKTPQFSHCAKRSFEGANKSSQFSWFLLCVAFLLRESIHLQKIARKKAGKRQKGQLDQYAQRILQYRITLADKSGITGGGAPRRQVRVNPAAPSDRLDRQDFRLPHPAARMNRRIFSAAPYTIRKPF